MKKLNVEESTEIMGIDLGTTNSAVSVYSADTVPTLLAVGGPGKKTLQSCVLWNGGDNFEVGEKAYAQRFQPNACYSVKRIMGSGKKITLVLPDTGEKRVFTPSEISAEILRKLKESVALYYKPLTKCVITVPAYFNQCQIEDTMEASKLAGLTCVQILKEPTSASYIYSLLGYATNGSVLIYDLGGGTFDVTHMTFLRRDSVPKKLLTSLRNQYGIDLAGQEGIEANDQYFCRVIGTYGDVNLGGDDIDREMANRIMKNQGLSLTTIEKEKLYLKCEEFKKSKFASMTCTLGGKKIDLKQEDLDEAVDVIFARTKALMSEIKMSEIKTIVLVGGSTKSQRLREDISAAFPNAELSAVLDPDATVALGAGSVAKAMSNDESLLYQDVLPLPIGILVDETSVEVCIPKNTSMPYAVTKTYNTLYNNQKNICVKVYQGLSVDPAACTFLGQVRVTDLPLAPAGDIHVSISFILNAQGRLRVTSKVKGIEKEETLIVDNIFNVEEDKPKDGWFDDFERTFAPLLLDNDKGLALLERRRETAEGSPERAELEELIVEEV